MSYWIEIHCDVIRHGAEPRQQHFHRCHTNRGDNPGVLAPNDRTGIGRKTLIKEARDAGWKFKGGQWICPGCQKP